MEPRTLSASAIATYEACPARYKATYIDRATEPSGVAATKGTAAHEVLEIWFRDGRTGESKKELIKLAETVIEKYGLDEASRKDVLDMLAKWHADFDGHGEVISLEEKFSFEIPHKERPITVNYIWDRCDRTEDGGIEVIDYKTIAIPLSADQMKAKIQPRLYALAAAIRFKDEKPDAIWVTYDMLRHGRVSVRFTREDIARTWQYLKDVYSRILEDDGTEEKIGPECRWCVRKASCESLNRAVQVGNIWGMGIDEAARRYAEIEHRIKALYGLKNEIEELLRDKIEEEGVPEVNLGGVVIEVTTKSTRKLDEVRARKIIPAELIASHATVGVTIVDALIKEGALDDDSVKELRGLITRSTTSGIRVRVIED